MAGKRLGKEDERHLWPEMLRVIKEVQPSWIVGENVFGLVNWSGGLVFHEVQADLEAAGYEVWPYVLPAAAVNAPHRRDRVWFVAYRNGSTTRPSGKSRSVESNWSENNAEQSEWGEKTKFNIGSFELSWDASNPNSRRLERSKEIGWDSINVERESIFGATTHSNSNGNGDVAYSTSKRLERKTGSIIQRSSYRFANGNRNDWSKFPTVSPVHSRNDGLSNKLDGITFSKWRQESIKAAGNAIVPQVMYQIFKAIQEFNETHR